ncbi:hypothetical protein ACHAXR_010658 [Thalassiosira sp. AJA248-18]
MNLGQKEFHIAPMLDVSTIEFRYFIRLLTKRAVIWNQMVVAETLVYRHRSSSSSSHCKENASCELSFEEEKRELEELTPELIKYSGWYDGRDDGGVSPHPTVCQLGSNDPDETAFATRVIQKCGYDSIDLNCECPSDRVAGRCFGAALMKDQDTAVDVVSSMVKTAQSLDKPLPVSVKTRIGVDENDSFDFISDYIQRLVDVGCKQFVIHARKVYTEGLSPAQNRTIPPLDYPRVYRLMKHFPQCSFLFNGGITSLDHAREIAFGSANNFDEFGNGDHENCNNADDDHSVPCQRCNLPQGSCMSPSRTAPPNLTGVMVGRLARDRPADLADIDRYFYGEACNPCANRRVLMERYISFLERVYPRRCCDDSETVSLGMAREMATPITHKKQCCSICQEFRGQNGGETTVRHHEDNNVVQMEGSMEVEQIPKATRSNTQQRQSGRLSRRHEKYNGAKIVTRIIDRAFAPTWGILAGESGQKVFKRVSHALSRDKTARNCGPGFILWKAMKSVPDDVWDKPFESSGERKATYYPTK